MDMYDSGRFEAALTEGRADGHVLYRGLYAKGVKVSTLDQHVSTVALFDERYGSASDALLIPEFNGYLAGLATAEVEVLEEGVRL